jgi:hypothetical protein
MKSHFALFTCLAFLVATTTLFAQSESLEAEATLDSTKTEKFDNHFGGGLNYTGNSLIESAVVEIQFKYTMKHHAIALGPHIAWHDLFGGQSNWARYGASLTYEYFPIRSNRLFSPFIFYDLNYAYSRSSRTVEAITPDGTGTYSASRVVQMHGLSHFFGIGTRANFYKGIFLHLSFGAGPATFGESVNLVSNAFAYPDIKTPESVFANYQTVYMFRIGLAYHFGLNQFKNKSQTACCD